MIHQYLFLSALCFPTWQCGSAVPFPLLPRILPSFSLSPTTFAQMRCTKRPSSKLQIKPHKDQIRTRCNYVPHMQGSIVKKLYFLTYSSKLVKFTISMLYNFSCAPFLRQLLQLQLLRNQQQQRRKAAVSFYLSAALPNSDDMGRIKSDLDFVSG